ncbi:MAG: hypothetical protein QG588_734 [Candidatus Poribacteria bacterium]|nr:hypothetical protein [Candidatus Poribacteria bacterium]
MEILAIVLTRNYWIIGGKNETFEMGNYWNRYDR